MLSQSAKFHSSFVETANRSESTTQDLLSGAILQLLIKTVNHLVFNKAKFTQYLTGRNTIQTVWTTAIEAKTTHISMIRCHCALSFVTFDTCEGSCYEPNRRCPAYFRFVAIDL